MKLQSEIMKKRSLSGNIGIGIFILSFLFIAVAFSTPSWLVSDDRLTGANLDRFGLWTHCFRSFYDRYNKRFFVGCRWIYDPFTTGYYEIRVQVLTDFIIATQFFFTLAFISTLLGGIGVLTYFLCCGPDQNKYILLIKAIAWDLVIGGVFGSLAVIIFASCANRKGWMPGHDNNFFGWSFILAAIGSIFLIIAGTLFFVETTIQTKKRKYLKESQTRFELEHESKA